MHELSVHRGVILGAPLPRDGVLVALLVVRNLGRDLAAGSLPFGRNMMLARCTAREPDTLKDVVERV